MVLARTTTAAYTCARRIRALVYDASMALVYAFGAGNQSSQSAQAKLAEVGGKGHSLIAMSSQSSVDVPSGFVLTVAFFEPWMELLRGEKEFEQFVSSVSEGDHQTTEVRDAICALKNKCSQLALNDAQSSTLNASLRECGLGTGALVAVRSSSPDEDLAGMSFAGGYETVLGVSATVDGVLGPLQAVFASCLDTRVVAYKKQHGMDVTRPRIAVVLQRMVDSAVAGVAFSCNPLNNDFDEILVNANWGLGESVVSGVCSPDTYVMRKYPRPCVVDATVGRKEQSVWLSQSKGSFTDTRPNSPEQSATRTLDDATLESIARGLGALEEFYGSPVDTEWAVDKEGHVLWVQARPVTTLTPVPPPLLTEPTREKRRLYLDITQSIQGLSQHLCPLSTSVMNKGFRCGFESLLGSSFIIDGVKGNFEKEPLLFVTHGKMYANLSLVFSKIDPQTLGRKLQVMDFLAGSALMSATREAYSTCDDKGGSGAALPNIPAKLVMRNPGIIPTAIRTMWNVTFGSQPRSVMDAGAKALGEEIKANSFAESKLPFHLWCESMVRLVIKAIPTRFGPTLILAKKLLDEVTEMANDVADDEAAKNVVGDLSQGLPGNVTVDLGLSLDRFSRTLTDQYSDADELWEAIQMKSIPRDGQVIWDYIIEAHGHRGPRELDLSAPRYSEKPHILLEQVLQLQEARANLKEGDVDMSPLQVEQRGEERRAQAVEIIGSLIGKKRGARQEATFRKRMQRFVAIGGVREHHKYYMIRALTPIRQEALRIAKELGPSVLESDEEIFNLTAEQIATVMKTKDKSFAKKCMDENTEWQRAHQTIKSWPRVFDSRGRHLHPPRPEGGDGVYVGCPVSSGVVEGVVKVLHSPEEPLNPGEVLVAWATDPGWTPLFVNASAVILEVGGALQHGALVAREYGKPCVVGIERATTVFKSGDRVRVDGAVGTVTILTA